MFGHEKNTGSESVLTRLVTRCESDQELISSIKVLEIQSNLGKVALHQLSHSRISYCFVLLLNTRHNIQDNPLSVNHFYAKK